MGDQEGIKFNIPRTEHNIIKVIGVGGGGGNAVNHMFRQGIHDVSFVVCNTDAKALSDSPVPVHVQLGVEGLGAGDKPERARKAAEESIDEIKKMLSGDTKMVFITAGMGGGTGTGAAPVIARVAKEMDILTVGIVTIPFAFEGRRKIDKALDGVEALSNNVDALLVINNERLRELYPNWSVMDAFAKADDTLTSAARSIAEIITVHGKINLDFNDVKTVLKDGGVAIMSSGYGEGNRRVSQAIEEATRSPLLNNNDIFKSQKVLLSISFNDDAKEGDTLMMEEMNEIHAFMDKFDKQFETKWGLSVDPTLGKKVKITVLATGFGLKNIPQMVPVIKKREDNALAKAQQEAAAAKAKAQQEEEEVSKAQRREKFYKGLGKLSYTKRHHYIYIFSTDDLCDEELISKVENTPTKDRTRSTLESFKPQPSCNGTQASVSTDDPITPEKRQVQPIRF